MSQLHWNGKTGGCWVMALNLMCEYPHDSSGRFLMHWAEEEPNAGSGHGTSPSSTLLLLFQHQLGSFIWSLGDKNRQQREKLFAKQGGLVLQLVWKPLKPVEEEQRAFAGLGNICENDEKWCSEGWGTSPVSRGRGVQPGEGSRQTLETLPLPKGELERDLGQGMEWWDKGGMGSDGRRQI